MNLTNNAPCLKVWELRKAWYASGKKTDLVMLRLHFKSCPDCRARLDWYHDLAKRAVMSDIDLEELKNV